MACPDNYKPSQTLLKSSLRSRVEEYPRIAALHGIAYVADPTRPKVERFGWLVCVVASTVATLGIIFTLMNRFQTDPMMNSLELRFSSPPLDLPRFYVCPPWESFHDIPPPKRSLELGEQRTSLDQERNAESVLGWVIVEDFDRIPKQIIFVSPLIRGNLYKYDRTFYKRLYLWDFGLFTWNMTYPDSLDNAAYLKKLFVDNAPSCDQFIHNSALMSLKESTRLNCSAFETTVTAAGICFLFRPSGHIKDEMQVSFSFNITLFPTRVYATLGQETELLRHLQSYVFLFSSSATTEVQETYTSPEAKVLTRSQRKCFFPGEQSPYVKCVLDCRIANSLKFCDCVPWYLAKDDINECQINRYKCLDSNSAEIVDISKCHCQLPCDNIVLKRTEFEVLPAKESCRINIRERSLLTYKRTVRFGWSDLFVSFGGIAGLFLGCSLLSIIEFGYYFSLRTYCGAVLSSPKSKHNVIKINVLDAAHPANLTRDQKRSVLPKKRVTFYDYVN